MSLTLLGSVSVEAVVVAVVAVFVLVVVDEESLTVPPFTKAKYATAAKPKTTKATKISTKGITLRFCFSPTAAEGMLGAGCIAETAGSASGMEGASVGNGTEGVTTELAGIDVGIGLSAGEVNVVSDVWVVGSIAGCGGAVCGVAVGFMSSII